LSLPGTENDLNTARFVVAADGPIIALRPVLPYVPAAGALNFVRSYHARIWSAFGRSDDKIGLPLTFGRWLFVPLRALSAPVTIFTGVPDRRDTSPLSCHPPATARRAACCRFNPGRSQTHEKDAMCFE